MQEQSTMNSGGTGRRRSSASQARGDRLRWLMEPLEPRLVLDGEAAPVDFAAGAMTGTLDAGEAPEEYTFAAEAGVEYRFMLDEGAQGADLDLLMPDGVSVYTCRTKKHCFDEHGWYERNEVLWRARETGSLRLSVARDGRSADPEAPVTYRVRTGTMVQPLTLDIAGATPLGHEGARGRLDGVSASSTHSFTAVEGNLYTLELSTSGENTALLSVFSAQGKSLARGYWSSVSWVAPSTGTYYVVAGGMPAADYTLTLRETVDDQNGRDVRLRGVGEVSGRIDFANDEDVVTIEAEGGKAYLITITGNAVSEKSFALELPVDGTYTLRIRPDGERAPSRYTVRMKEAPDDEDAPMRLNSGDRVKGRIDYPEDTDRFTFEAKAGTVYSALASVVAGPRHAEADVTIYDASGHAVEVDWGTAVWFAPADQTYTIVVGADDVLTYELSLTSNPGDVGHLRSVGETAAAHGRLDRWDQQYFWFVGETGKPYRIELEMDRRAHGWLVLQDSDGDYINDGRRMTLVPRRTKVFLLSLDRWGGGKTAFDYSVSVNKLVDPPEEPVREAPPEREPPPEPDEEDEEQEDWVWVEEENWLDDEDETESEESLWDEEEAEWSGEESELWEE